MRVVFMGTPEFAVASLDALLKGGINIVAVVTAPDKPAGRGMKLIESPVKKYAVRHGLKTLQPEKLKAPEFIEELRSLNADLQVVVAFRMLPEIIWNMPPKRYDQPAWFVITAIPGRCSYQLGSDQWRKRNGCNHFPPKA